MSSRGIGTFALAGFAALLGAGLALQWHAASPLRVEREQLQHEKNGLARLSLEHERLLASQPSKAEQEERRLLEGEIARWRGEVETLRRRVREEEAVAAVQAERSPVNDEMVDASNWKNAGRFTPAAALETTLWAAAGGDLDALANSLVLAPEARVRAEALLASLPDSMRASYATPEHLIALFTVKDIPLGSMQVRKQTPRGSDETAVRVRLRSAEGHVKDAELTLRRDEGGWRLVVPESAVRRYETMLGKTASARTP